nr:cilia- and flagella-associated protein 251-like [Cherax quadricarinatus]
MIRKRTDKTEELKKTNVLEESKIMRETDEAEDLEKFGKTDKAESTTGEPRKEEKPKGGVEKVKTEDSEEEKTGVAVEERSRQTKDVSEDKSGSTVEAMETNEDEEKESADSAMTNGHSEETNGVANGDSVPTQKLKVNALERLQKK